MRVKSGERAFVTERAVLGGEVHVAADPCTRSR